MKLFLLFTTLFLFSSHEISAKPSPQPNPENDVHFHVNMQGAGKSYPLKGNIQCILPLLQNYKSPKFQVFLPNITKNILQLRNYSGLTILPLIYDPVFLSRLSLGIGPMNSPVPADHYNP